MMSFKVTFLLLVIGVVAAHSSSSYKSSPLFGENNNKLGIFAGKKSSIKKHPYMAAVIVDGNQICAATICSKKFVLTSPSCIHGAAVSSIKILVGSNNGLSGGKSYSVKQVIVHPSYAQSLDYSYAAIELTKALKWSKTVKPTKMCGKLPKDGTKMVVAGWGSTSVSGKHESNGMLMEGTMMWYNIKTCNSMIPAPWTPRMACAYNKGKTTLCDGDFGDVYVSGKSACGMMTALIRSGMCSTEARPLMLMNFQAEKEWIQNTTRAKYVD